MSNATAAEEFRRYWTEAHLSGMSDEEIQEEAMEVVDSLELAEKRIEAVKTAAIYESSFLDPPYLCTICGGGGNKRDQVIHSFSCWLAIALDLQRRPE